MAIDSENFEIWDFKTMQSGLILLFDVIVLPSPWLKENSEISLPETLQNGLILLFYIEILVEKITMLLI